MGGIRFLTVIIALIGLALPGGGCINFTYVKTCMPYVGDDPPNRPRVKDRQTELEKKALKLDGLDLTVELCNDQVVTRIALIPTLLKWESDWRYSPDEYGHTILLTFKPHLDGFVLDPRKVILGGYETFEHNPVACIVIDDQPVPFREEGKVVGGIRLPAGVTTRVALNFDMKRTSPDREMWLKLGEAVHAPGQAAIPEIRFVPRAYCALAGD
jgi:hypothetical protein